MEALYTTWSFLLLFGLLAFPQLFGVLLFIRVKRYQHFLAHLLGFVTPVLMSIFFCWMFFVYRYYQAHPDERCGLPLLGGLFLILLSAGIQLVFGMFAQISLHRGCAKR